MWRLVATRNKCNKIKQKGGGDYTDSWKLILPTTVKYTRSPRSRWPGSFISKNRTINEQVLLGEHLS